MTVNKRKKNSRLRASHTHGWGSKKKHRGAGHRGGRGNAGSGKRADAKKPSYWGDTKYFGKHGFKMKGVTKDVVPINLKTLEESLSKFVKDGHAKEEKGSFVVDLTAAGFSKLLSSGKAIRKLTITVEEASPVAVEKVKKAGGEVKTVQA